MPQVGERRLTLQESATVEDMERFFALMDAEVGVGSYTPHPTNTEDDRTTVTIWDIEDERLVRLMLALGQAQMYVLLDYAPEGAFVEIRTEEVPVNG